MRDALVISLARLRAWWILAGVLLAFACAGAAAWRDAERRRDDVLAEGLARLTNARAAAAEEARRSALARSHEDALVRVASLPLPRGSAGAVERLRADVRGAGLASPRIESIAVQASGTLGVVHVRVDGSATYPSLRTLLADLEARPDPIAWKSFAFDGDRASLELAVLYREPR